MADINNIEDVYVKRITQEILNKVPNTAIVSCHRYAALISINGIEAVRIISWTFSEESIHTVEILYEENAEGRELAEAFRNKILNVRKHKSDFHVIEGYRKVIDVNTLDELYEELEK